MNAKKCALCLVVLLCCVATVQGQKITVKGSNTFGEDLGPALIEGFKETRPGIDVELVSISSGYGIAALLEGACDIASSSRSLNEDELRLVKSRRLRVEHHPVGYYGIAVVVQPNHPVKALSDYQVEGIFTGEITNWKEVGGPDLPIKLHIADANAGTYLGFRELAMSDRAYAENATPHLSYHELGEAVAKDQASIGYVSLNVMREQGLHGILVNGVHPSSIAVIEGLYPYARMVRLISRRGETSSDARAFIRFAQSSEGQNIVERIGFVPRMTSPISYGGIEF